MNSQTYNSAGRLKTVTTSTGTTTFVYNTLGQMIDASGPSGTTLYVYDQGGHLLGEYDGSGTLIQETVWLGNIPVANIRPNGGSVSIDYVETDQLNTPRAVIQPSNNAVLWSWYSGPFGSTAPNENPSGAGTFFYDLRFPGEIAGAWGSTFQNTYRDYEPAIGRYVESDPIGLRGGSYSTYSYSGSNPISNFDPSGLYCTSSGGTTTCSYPGGPSFQIPTPIGFPASISSSNFLLYHSYEVSASTNCSDASMLQALINSPAPGSSISPASANGTPNVAQVFGVNNPILSYVTTDLNTGNPIVVNVTNSTGGLSPGYVARTVSNEVVQNYGEGLSLIQSSLVFSPVVNFLLDQYVWRSQTNSAAKKCGCNQ